MTKVVWFLLLFAATNGSVLFLFPLTLGRFLLVTGLYASGTAVMLVLLFHPRSRWLAAARCTVPCGTEPCVALTFDDGPSDEVTPRVLAILREKKVRATFFLVGREVDRHPALARSVCAEGHAIGNHTYSHPPLFCFLTPRRLRGEIRRAQQAISQATGVRPIYFRSPVGLRHPLLESVLEEASLTFVLWALRTYDTRALQTDALGRRILNKVRPGSIILLHDRSGPGSETMLASLPGVIDRLREQGYRFVTVEESRAGGLGPSAASRGRL
jgi:peptidoglycan/xylan/chitin deacetylase (PgdA/CDA1 family)